MKRNGIDFFPMSTDFFEDDKIELIEGEYGYFGAYVAIRLLCKIYRFEGYYCLWGADESMLLAKRLDVETEKVDEVIEALFRRGIFSRGIYEKRGILTSRGIQTRFLDACRRRGSVVMRRDITLIDTAPYSNVVFEGELVPTQVLGQPEKPTRGRPRVLADENADQLAIIEMFTWSKNFALPVRQYKKLVNWNTAHGNNWKRMTSEQRMASAELWEQTDEKSKTKVARKKHEGEAFDIMKALYDACVTSGADRDVRMDLLKDDCRLELNMSSKDGKVNVIHISPRAWEYVCHHKETYDAYYRVNKSGNKLVALINEK